MGEYMGTVTENMKIFLVTVVLCLTILGQAGGAPGQHLLIETEDGADSSEGGDEMPAVGAGWMMDRCSNWPPRGKRWGKNKNWGPCPWGKSGYWKNWLMGH